MPSNRYEEIVGKHPIGCRVFDLNPGNHHDAIFTVPNTLDDFTEVCDLHQKHIGALHTHFMCDSSLPFGPITYAPCGRIFGDFTSPAGQDELMGYRLTVSERHHILPEAIRPVWDLMRLRRKHTIHHDGKFVCLRQIDQGANDLSLVISPGRYSEAKFSMDAEGHTLGITNKEFEFLAMNLTYVEQCELEELYTDLCSRHNSDLTIRQIIHQMHGGLPTFNDGIYHHVIGIAGVILTEDGWVVVTRRGSSVSVNHGINCPISGGVDWDNTYMPSSVVELVARQTALEAHEEAGIRAFHPSLTPTCGSNGHITILGLVRELARGGSPEFMCCIQYRGSLAELISTMASNGHCGKAETDRFIYALPLVEARRIPREAPSFHIHPKARLNLVLLDHAIARGTIEPP